MKKSAIGKKTETPGLRLNLPTISTNSAKTVNDMDKIEKIRQEIKQLRKLIDDHNYYLDNSEQALGYGLALDDIGQFLDTLLKGSSESLQEEIETWIPAHISIRTDETLPINPTELADACKEWGKCIARHFAEWQKQQMLKDAEECELYWDGDFLAIDLNMTALGYSKRDKVKVIVLKAEEE